ncbi:MAG: S41 family peptidase [Campylobacterota bacterium]
MILKVLFTSIICCSIFLNAATFDLGEKRYLHELFHDKYYWHDKVVEDDYLNYETPNNMIDNYKYSLDKWSYAQTFEAYYNSQNQYSYGFGLYVSSENRIIHSLIDSPSYDAGLRRGDEILKISGNDVDSEVFYNAQEQINTSSTFLIKRDNKLLEVEVISQDFNYKVSSYNLFIQKDNNKKIGYFIYDSFTSKSSEEIENAFDFFKLHKIDDLIIDFRYNNGGSLAVASLLLDKIAGKNREGMIQSYSNWNEDYQFKNDYYRFMEHDNSIDIHSVYFLTTNRTASASEIVINSLKPYINVNLIGSTTHGKPVGMKGYYTYDNNESGDYIYWLVNFSIYNANYEGEYFNGLDVDCNTMDSYNYRRSDFQDNMLSEALYHIKYGNCSYENSLGLNSFYKASTITLNQGWNLISLPYNNIMNMDNLDENITTIFSYENNSWKVWIKDSTNTSYDELYTLEDGYGYWVYSTSDNIPLDIKVTSSPDLLQIQSNTWSLQGSRQISDFDSFFDSTGTSIIWKYKDGKYKAIAKDSQINSKLISNDINLIESIEKYEGFWVR